MHPRRKNIMGPAYGFGPFAQSLVKRLRKQGAKLILSAPRASGTAPLTGVQSPWVDLSKNGNNAVGSNFSGTQTSGWVTDILACDTGVEHTITNLLGNDGNFGVDSNADGLADGWSIEVGIGAKSLLNGVQTTLATALNGRYYYGKNGIAQNSKMYAFCYTKVASGNMKIQLYCPTGTTGDSAIVGDGTFKFASVEGIVGSSGNTNTYVFDQRVSSWTPIETKLFHLLNKTTIFGAGKEPTQAQMDRLVQWMIARFGYVNTKILKLAWRSMQRFDGVDDFDAITNSASMDLGVVAGKEQVWSVLFRASIGAASSYLLNKNLDSLANQQYGLLYDSSLNAVNLNMNGGSRGLLANGEIIQNEFYVLTYHRDKTGLITPYKNKVSKPTSFYSTALTTQPNVRIGRRETAAAHFKGDMALLNLYEADTLDIAKILDLEWKIARDYIYTGV